MKKAPVIRAPKPIGVGPVRLRVVRDRGQQAAGTWYWRAELNRDGRSVTIWTGWATTVEAQREVAALVARDQLDGGPRATEAKTVRDLLEFWIGAQEERVDVAPHTISARRTHCRALAGVLGPTRLDRLDPIALDGYRNARLREGYAPRTIYQELQSLRMACRWASRVGLVRERLEPPMPRIRMVSVRPRHTPLGDEVAEVLARLDGWARRAVYLLWATGMRPGEAARLTWSDVQLDRGILRLRSGKTGARTVPLSDEAVAELATWPRAGERLLGVSPSTIASLLNQRIAAACADAQLERWTAYGLRRSAVDRLARAHVDVATAAAILGHSPTVMLRVYRTVRDEDRVEAATRAQLGAVPARKGGRS